MEHEPLTMDKVAHSAAILFLDFYIFINLLGATFCVRRAPAVLDRRVPAAARSKAKVFLGL
jgi:hypothetical protein